MNLEEMGQILRQERERQGITLEKIASEIKVSRRYLVALEEGRKDDLPHPVYAKGFLKNYARQLGLDPAQFSQVFEQHLAVEEDHLRNVPRYEVKEPPSGLRDRLAAPGFRPSLWLALPVAVVFAGLVWFFFFSSPDRLGLLDSVTRLFKSDGQTAEQAAPPPAPAKTPPKPAVPEPAPAEPTPPVQRDLLATTPGPTAKSPAAPVQPAAPSDEPTPARLAAEAAFGQAGNQSLEVTATQPCKLEVTDETGQSRTFTLLKGQRLNFRFTDKVAIRFVTAPVVAVKLNGKDYPLDGGKAEGKTIQFP